MTALVVSVTGLRSLARDAEMLGLGPGARTLEEMALNAAGEVWNLRQLPDLANPKRAVISQLTRFKPTIRDPGAFRLLRDVRVDFASVGPWPLAGMFSPEGPKVLGGFAWEATMIVKGGRRDRLVVTEVEVAAVSPPPATLRSGTSARALAKHDPADVPSARRSRRDPRAAVEALFDRAVRRPR